MSPSEVSLRLLPAACVVITLLLANDSVSAAEYDDVPKTFLELIAKGDPSAAYAYAGSTTTLWDQDTVESMGKQADKALAKLGDYSYHEVLSEQKAGTRFVKICYIIGYEKGVAELSMTLYRPKDKWIVFATNFNLDPVSILAPLPAK